MSFLFAKFIVPYPGLSTNVITKLGKNQNVSTEVLGKICKVLNCDITDIMEFVDDEQKMTANDAR